MDGEKKAKVKKELIEWGKSLLFAAVIVGLLFGFVIMPYTIVGSSMEPTLLPDDRVIVYQLFYSPKQGDIVILSEDTGLNETLVKRVIALEGQTVDIDADGYVWVDGERYADAEGVAAIQENWRGDMDYPVTVPEGCIFVMGDNRNASTDSRDERVGFVNADEVKGKVVLRIRPLSRFGLVD